VVRRKTGDPGKQLLRFWLPAWRVSIRFVQRDELGDSGSAGDHRTKETESLKSLVDCTMTLSATQYLGESARRWDLDGLPVTLTRYPACQRQARHRHENPTYFFLLGGEFSDLSDLLGERTPNRFELLFHPSQAWNEGKCGPRGRYGLNVEPTSEWLGRFDLEFDDLGSYRIDGNPVRSLEMLRLATIEFQTSDIVNLMLEILLPDAELPVEDPAWLRKAEALGSNPEGVTWNLSSLAHEVCVHPIHLARVFRRRHGCSVSEWLLCRRLLNAADRLIQGQSASEVAHESGFADQSHFGRVFRTYFGWTPLKFKHLWLE
jgi:AraC family transcriptional regulator